MASSWRPRRMSIDVSHQSTSVLDTHIHVYGINAARNQCESGPWRNRSELALRPALQTSILPYAAQCPSGRPGSSAAYHTGNHCDQRDKVDEHVCFVIL